MDRSKCVLVLALTILLSAFLFQVCNGHEVHWSKWSIWSNCSRPCGGGVTQKTRECIKENNETNATCNGDHVQYQMCNIQDCPDGTPGFRMQQCSVYNSKIYKGKFFKWADFSHSAGECELKCMPKNDFFYVTFKDKVIDGTPCNKFSLDVCINGTCQPVGCDNQLYSDAKVDTCGVCRGDNSTCYPVKEVYKVSREAYGYVDVTTIPQGATNIKIKEIGSPTLYLALTTSSKSVVNGDYIFDSPQKQIYESSILVYQRNEKTNQILINGPVEVPLQVKVFVMEGVNDVSFEYSVPSSFSSKKPTQYIYVMSAWGECSKTCASGERKRTVYCANEATRTKVAPFYCNTKVKPHTTEKCNTESCPARWYISQWAACSQTCGRGLRTRRVHCVRTKEDGNIEMLENNKCPGQVPIRTENCVDQGTCPKWTVKEWSKCSKTCGEGFETRQAECMNMEDNSVEEYRCSLQSKPITKRPCFNAPCGAKWRAGVWGECSSECGQGMRSRPVTCWNTEGIEVPLYFCDVDEEPAHFIDCTNSGPCKPQWRAGMWSKCSAKCGKGKQMRTLICTVLIPQLNRLEVLDNSKCNSQEKPRRTQRCKSDEPCRVIYHVNEWGQCSVSCGEGVVKRNVRCFADENIDYTENACANLVRPLDHKVCYQPKCGGPKDVATSTTPVPQSKHSVPKVNITGQKILHVGDNADYICKVSGYPQPLVSWKLNGKPLTSSRFRQIRTNGGSKLIVIAASSTDSGALSCVANNTLGHEEQKMYINVYSKPTVSMKEAYIKKFVGDQFVLTCDVNGHPTPRIQWQKNNDIFRPDGIRIVSNGYSITFKKTLLKDEGNYDCIAFNLAGSSTASVELVVESTVITSPAGSKPDDNPDCKDDDSGVACSLAPRVGLCGYPRYRNVVCCKTCKGLKS